MDEKPFVCGKCKKAFNNPYHLICHKRIHSGEKPYRCLTCGKNFRQCGGLIAHRRTHTGEKLFKCSLCDKEYSQPSGLQKHNRTHSSKGYSCRVCKQQFSKASDLMKHKITHNCGKKFDCYVKIRDALPAKNLRGTHPGVNLFRFDIRVKVSKESYSDSPNETTLAPSQKQSYPCGSLELLSLHEESHKSEEESSVEPSGLELECCSDIEREDNGSLQTVPTLNLEISHICENVFTSSELLTLHKESSHTEQQMDDVEKEEQNLNNELVTSSLSQEVTSSVSQETVFTSSELLTLHKQSHRSQQMSSVASHAPKLLDCRLDIELEDYRSLRMNDDVSRKDVEHRSDNGLEDNEESSNNAPHQTAPTLDYLLEDDEESFDSISHESTQTVSEEEFYQSDLPGEVFASSELLTSHEESHTKKQMNDVVNGLKANKESLNDRSRQILLSMSAEESYQCDSCKRIFESSQHLTLHKKYHHALPQKGNDVSLNQSECHLDSNELQSNEDFPLSVGQEDSSKCELSEKELLALQKESLHTGQQMTRAPCEQLENSFGSGPHREALNWTVKKESYQCNLCQREFASSELLTLHKDFHTGQQISDVVYHEPLDYNLDDELDADEPSGITYICADCDEEFELADGLFRHAEVAHAI